MESKKKNCYTCKNRGSVPGSAHSSCAVDWSKSNNDMPKWNEHGVKNGWVIFPWNFDPVWMIGQCSEYNNK